MSRTHTHTHRARCPIFIRSTVCISLPQLPLHSVVGVEQLRGHSHHCSASRYLVLSFAVTQSICMQLCRCNAAHNANICEPSRQGNVLRAVRTFHGTRAACLRPYCRRSARREISTAAKPSGCQEQLQVCVMRRRRIPLNCIWLR